MNPRCSKPSAPFAHCVLIGNRFVQLTTRVQRRSCTAFLMAANEYSGGRTHLECCPCPSCTVQRFSTVVCALRWFGAFFAQQRPEICKGVFVWASIGWKYGSFLVWGFSPGEGRLHGS